MNRFPSLPLWVGIACGTIFGHLLPSWTSIAVALLLILANYCVSDWVDEKKKEKA